MDLCIDDCDSAVPQLGHEPEFLANLLQKLH